VIKLTGKSGYLVNFKIMMRVSIFLTEVHLELKFFGGQFSPGKNGKYNAETAYKPV
jgi:hypothetical protein